MPARYTRAINELMVALTATTLQLVLRSRLGKLVSLSRTLSTSSK